MIGAAAKILGGLLASCTALAAATAQLATLDPGFYRVQVGDLEITALSDGTPARRADQSGDPASAPINGYLVNTAGKLVLIDAGAGTLLGPGVGELVSHLRAAGFEPEQVAEVYVTDMQPGHSGGLVSERKPAFPSATVRASRAESDYWLAKSSLLSAAVEDRQRFAEVGAAFKPYLIARRLETFDQETALGPEIRALPSRGPGPTVYVAESRGEKIVFLGDEDPHAPVATHVGLLEEAATHGYWVAGAHRPFPGFGHLRAARQGFEWIPTQKTAP